MSTEKVYYCSSCQNASQYSEINTKINNLTSCFSNDEYITSDFYKKSYDLLYTIRNFGDKDSNNPRLPNIDAYFSLDTVNNLKNQLISHHFYDDIINSINNNSNSNKQYEIIYGSYWTNLKNILQTIKISDTKYYEKSCCDCNGYCSSDGFYCSGHGSGGCSGCVQGHGECCSGYTIPIPGCYSSQGGFNPCAM